MEGRQPCVRSRAPCVGVRHDKRSVAVLPERVDTAMVSVVKQQQSTDDGCGGQ
jgi:hypothetical protein